MVEHLSRFGDAEKNSVTMTNGKIRFDGQKMTKYFSRPVFLLERGASRGPIRKTVSVSIRWGGHREGRLGG